MSLPTIFLVFLASTGGALVLTPKVAGWSSKLGIFDHPSSRRVHGNSVPRAGGVALFFSFFSVYILVIGITSEMSFSALLQEEQIFFLLGGLGAFLLGFCDDVRGLHPWFKLVCQVFIGCFVWMGGIDVESLSITLHRGVMLSGWLSMIVTVFWVVLLINAINLIDGLDGLAAGVCLFVSLTLLVVCYRGGDPVLVFGFTALAGTCFGFLRYNFNPASVFMGDCGSYFLGYILAVLTIQGAMKSHATVALLIPVISLGVPLVDTFIAPIRRFIIGEKLFSPDKNHFHHLLMKMGYSHKKAVYIIYSITIILGVVSFSFVFVKDKWSAYIMLIPAILFLSIARKSGYMEYIATDKILGWIRDVTDEAGISNERRSFLNIQMQILQSENFEFLWSNICVACEKLDFDLVQIDYFSENLRHNINNQREWRLTRESDFDLSAKNNFKLEMPLIGGGGVAYGTLWLVKDLQRSNMSHYTLRRVEHLRRTVIGVLERFDHDR